MKHLLLCALGCCCMASAAQDSTRPNFTGNWHLDTAKSEVHSRNQPAKLDIQQTDGSIAISEEAEGKTESVKCETNGKNCAAKEDGEPADISFYFNGPLLVEMDMIGHNKDRVVKKRLKMGEDGKTMEVEVLHINPQGPAEKWVFAKD